MKAIICSKKDEAGTNMHKYFLKHGFRESEKEFQGNKVYRKNEFELYLINKEQIYADEVNSIPAEAFIFASKHSSKAEKKSLTVHPIGNWSKADFGGKDSELIKTSSHLMKNYLISLNKWKEKLLLDFEVTFESTHHGPALTKPTVFIETGGTEKEWNDLNAVKAVCETIVNETKFEGKGTISIGLGGTHYASLFSKMALNQEFSFSHMCPKHCLEFLNEEMIEKAIANTMEKVEAIVLDWKGLGQWKEKVLELSESTELEVIKRK